MKRHQSSLGETRGIRLQVLSLSSFFPCTTWPPSQCGPDMSQADGQEDQQFREQLTSGPWERHALPPSGMHGDACQELQCAKQADGRQNKGCSGLFLNDCNWQSNWSYCGGTGRVVKYPEVQHADSSFEKVDANTATFIQMTKDLKDKKTDWYLSWDALLSS